MNFESYREALMYVCLAGLTLTGMSSFVLSSWPFIRESWDSLGCRSAKAIFFISVAGSCMFAGAKHIVGRITYPRTDPEVWYLNDAGSVVSNDFLRICFSRNIIVPATASLFIDGLELKYTNELDWATHSFNAYSNTFDRMSVPFDLPFSAATNYNWIVYTDWTPPPVVHTNGIAFVVWQIGDGKMTNDLTMTRTGIYTNGAKVAPNPAITNGPPITITDTLTQGETGNE